MKKNLQNFKTFAIVLGAMLITSLAQAATRTASVSGSWNSVATWGGASFPVAGDDVIINSGITVTVTADAACATITFLTTTTVTATISINSGFTLDVSGLITIPRATTNFNRIAVGAGILNAGSIAFTNGGGAVRHEITISTGTVNVSGNVTQVASTGSASITFTGAGLLQLGGTFLTAATGTLTPSTGTVEFNAAAAQSTGDFIFNNVILSGSGAKTTTGATISGILSMQGTATATGTTPTYGASAILEYKGSTAQTTGNTEFPATLNADLTIDNAAGVTLNAGKTLNGTLTLTAGTLAAGTNLTMSAAGTPLIIRNGGSMTGTLQGANDYDVSFIGSSKTTGGELSGSGLADVTVNLTAGQTLTLDQARQPDGNLALTSGTFAAGTFLTMGTVGTPVITRSEGDMTGTIQGANDYDVTYTGSSKTTGPELNNGGLLTIIVNLTGGQTLTLDANRAPDGNLTLSAGTFDLSTFTINRSGAGGTLTISDGSTLKIGGTNTFPSNYNTHVIGNVSATVEYAGTAQAVAAINGAEVYTNLTLSGSGIKTFAAETVNGTLSIQGTATTAGTTPTYGAAAVLEYKGSSAQNTSNVELPAAMGADLVINNASGVTLNGTKTLSASLTLTTGELITTTGTLLIMPDNFSTVNGGSNTSYVSGPIRKVGNNAFTFPVGKAGIYSPITITAPDNNADAFQVEYRRESATALGPINAALVGVIFRVSNCEYWDIDEIADAGGATTISITAGWSSGSGCGNYPYINNFSAIRLVHFDDVSTNTWNSQGGTPTGDNTTGTVTRTGVSIFSPFALGSTVDNANPLPVNLVNLRAFEKGTGIQIEWTNLTETELVGYFVERSSNGRDYTTIGQVAPRANAGDRESYSSIDAAPLSGVSYYRIRATELDGKSVYSKAIRVVLGDSPKGITLYPNPVRGNEVSIGFSAVKGQYDLRVMNTAGQEVYTQRLSHPGGTITQTITLPSSLKSGVYSMLISGNNFREAKMFVIQ